MGQLFLAAHLACQAAVAIGHGLAAPPQTRQAADALQDATVAASQRDRVWQLVPATYFDYEASVAASYELASQASACFLGTLGFSD